MSIEHIFYNMEKLTGHNLQKLQLQNVAEILHTF